MSFNSAFNGGIVIARAAAVAAGGGARRCADCGRPAAVVYCCASTGGSNAIERMGARACWPAVLGLCRRRRGGGEALGEEGTWVFAPKPDEFRADALLDLRGMNEAKSARRGLSGCRRTAMTSSSGMARRSASGRWEQTSIGRSPEEMDRHWPVHRQAGGEHGAGCT